MKLAVKYMGNKVPLTPLNNRNLQFPSQKAG